MLMKYRLFTPGPTSVPEATLIELAKPVHHHRTAEFRAMFNEVQALLQYVYQTKSTVYTITGSGTAAAEAGIVSTLGPGKRALCVTNGKFAERWSQVCQTYGIEKKDLKLEYGDAPTPEQIANELKAAKYDAVILVHSETSTATVADLEGIGRAMKQTSPDTLLIVDGITSIGALPFKMDAWGVDVAITGSQKALMLPPGLGFVALSDRAWAAVDANKAQKDFYLDLKKYKKSIADGDTPFTPANTLIKAQRVSLKKIRAEGIENLWARHARMGAAARAAVAAMGLTNFAERPNNALTVVAVPRGIDGNELLKNLEKKYGYKLANGQDTLKGKIWRLSHMGYCDAFDVIGALSALELALLDAGFKLEPGAGVAAAQRALAASR